MEEDGSGAVGGAARLRLGGRGMNTKGCPKVRMVLRIMDGISDEVHA